MCACTNLKQGVQRSNLYWHNGRFEGSCGDCPKPETETHLPGNLLFSFIACIMYTHTHTHLQTQFFFFAFTYAYLLKKRRSSGVFSKSPLIHKKKDSKNIIQFFSLFSLPLYIWTSFSMSNMYLHTFFLLKCCLSLPDDVFMLNFSVYNVFNRLLLVFNLYICVYIYSYKQISFFSPFCFTKHFVILLLSLRFG